MRINDLCESYLPELGRLELAKLFHEVESADVDDLWVHWNIANGREPYARGFDDMHGPVYQDWLWRHLDERLSEAYGAIVHRMVGDLIPIYRVITAPENWTPDPNRHPGVCWSWDKAAAAAHCGTFEKGHVQWMMEAFCSRDDVDWYETYRLNIMAIGDDEREIRLKANAPVKVEKFYRHR